MLKILQMVLVETRNHLKSVTVLASPTCDHELGVFAPTSVIRPGDPGL